MQNNDNEVRRIMGALASPVYAIASLVFIFCRAYVSLTCPLKFPPAFIPQLDTDLESLMHGKMAKKRNQPTNPWHDLDLNPGLTRACKMLVAVPPSSQIWSLIVLRIQDSMRAVLFFSST